MIKNIIFDLDGVLLNAKQHHFKALNDALPEEFRISDEEHLTQYDGLPTFKKLVKLTELKGLPAKEWRKIELKKKDNLESYLDSLKPDQQKIDLFKELRKNGYKLYVASNAI